MVDLNLTHGIYMEKQITKHTMTIDGGLLMMINTLYLLKKEMDI